MKNLYLVAIACLIVLGYVDSRAAMPPLVELSQEPRLLIIKQMTVDEMQHVLLVCNGKDNFLCLKEFVKLSPHND